MTHFCNLQDEAAVREVPFDQLHYDSQDDEEVPEELIDIEGGEIQFNDTPHQSDDVSELISAII